MVEIQKKRFKSGWVGSQRKPVSFCMRCPSGSLSKLASDHGTMKKGLPSNSTSTMTIIDKTEENKAYGIMTIIDKTTM
jgi:hypothetical protein